jgi:hypothetical protein
MHGQRDHRPTDGQATEDIFVVTRRGVMERLGDPYLTDHDRWVLGQFARFLGGLAPYPDPRVVRLPARRPLYSRVRRATL